MLKSPSSRVLRTLLAAVLLVSLPGCSVFGSGEVGAELSGPRYASLPGKVDWRAVSTRNTELTCPTLAYTLDYPSLLPDNRPEYDKAFEFYSTRGRRSLESSVLRSEPYIRKLEEIFEQHSLPLELLNIAIIESNFRSEAKSRMGAVGMWQFMRSTARLYGLSVTKRVDERKDILKSTTAAAEHLRDLYNTFNDWYLAVAAYNAGVGGVQRAIEKTGSRDFFELAKRSALRKETINFVINFFAVSKVVADIRHSLPSGATFASARAPTQLPMRYR